MEAPKPMCAERLGEIIKEMRIRALTEFMFSRDDVMYTPDMIMEPILNHLLYLSVKCHGSRLEPLYLIVTSQVVYDLVLERLKRSVNLNFQIMLVEAPTLGNTVFLIEEKPYVMSDMEIYQPVRHFGVAL